tara:strand:- start:707 stop:985 length:279 start_codon:yes stop_codon:yes gene_type:complete
MLMQTLIIFMSFLDFMFYPLIVATIVAVIIEQIMRRTQSASEQAIYIAMRIRKFLYNQALIVNVLWFLGYAILMFTVGRQAPQQMPDMIWKG